MMKAIMLLILFVFTCNAYSGEWASKKTIKNIYTFNSGQVWVSVDDASNMKTCKFYGGELYFDTNTDGGKNLLATLIAAKMSSLPVNLSYNATSSEVGSDESNGCEKEKMAFLWAVTL